MTKPRVSARDQIRVVATLLGLPEPFCRQVTARMKTDGRLPATRPVATDATPQSLARLVLGLCSPIPSKSSDLEIRLGALPRTGGDGAASVEQEIEELLAESVGQSDDDDIDFSAGDILVGITNPVVAITVNRYDGTSCVRTYRAATFREDASMTKYVRIPLSTLRLLAVELLEV